MSEIGAKKFIPTELADENTTKSIYGGLEGHYSKWLTRLVTKLQSGNIEKCDCSNENSETCCQSVTNETNGKNGLLMESDDDDDAGGCKNGTEDIMDVEDMGDYIETSLPTKVRFHI